MDSFVLDATQFIIEPKDLWTSRLGSKHRDVGPRAVALPDGGEGWAFENGAWYRPLGLDASAGRSPVEFKDHGLTYASVRKGMYDAKARLADMDIDGIDAALIFPTFASDIRSIRDAELHVACVKAYNDGVLDWAKQGDAKRLFPQAIMPATGLDAATTELQRVVKGGIRGIVFNGWPNGGEKPVAADDKFWSICQEAGIVVDLVRGGPVGADRAPIVPPQYIGKGASHVRPLEAPLEIQWAATMNIKNNNLVWFVLPGILDRFPKLNLAMIDCGAGWIPQCGELLDWLYRYEQFIAFAKLKDMPSDYVRRQVFATYNGERSTIAARRDFPAGCLMWSSNYPSNSSTWPRSREAIEDHLSGVAAADRQRIVSGNCAALYGIRVPAAV